MSDSSAESFPVRPGAADPAVARTAGAADAADAVAARRRYLAGLAIAALASVLFSGKAIVAKLIFRYEVDAVMVITLRMLLAAPFFIAVAMRTARGAAPLTRADRWRVLGLGFCGYYLSSFLDFLGLQYISAGLERLILYLTPTFVMLISAGVLRRRIRAAQWLALALAYAGIVLAFAHDLDFAGRAVWIGGALVMAAAFSQAVYLVGSGELVGRLGSLRLVALAMCVSTVFTLVQFVLLKPFAALALPAGVYTLSAINAVFCTVLPVFLTMVGVVRIGASAASQAGMIGPVSTMLLGWWLLGEPITGWQTAGAVLVMAGIAVLSIGPRPARVPVGASR